MHLNRRAGARLASWGAALATIAFASGCVVVLRGYGHGEFQDERSDSRAGHQTSDGETRSRDLISESRTLSVAHESGQSLIVKTTFGKIEVRQGGVDSVTIDAEVTTQWQNRLDKIAVNASRRADGALQIEPDWGDRHRNGDSMSFVVTIPDASRVTLEGRNGTILMVGLECPTIAKTRNGTIELFDVGGPVTAATENGTVFIRQSSSATGHVRAETVNGGVTLELGDAFEGTMRVSSRIGPIDIDEIGDLEGGRSVVALGGRTVSFTVGDGSVSESWARTMNGPVRISARQ